MWPSVGSSKPPIIRSVVVLPQPDGPSSAKKAPRGISTEIPSTATASSNRLTTPSSRTSAVAAAVAVTGRAYRGAYRAAKRSLDALSGVRRHHHEHRSLGELHDDLHRAPDVLGEDRGGEPVAHAVGHLDRVVVGRERLHGDDRAEHLVLDDLGVLADVGDDGRLDEEAALAERLATRDDRRLRSGGALEEAEDALLLQRRRSSRDRK